MKCLNTEFFRRKFLLRASLVNYITEVYVAGRKSGSSCRHYRRLAELLKEFEQKLGRKILSDSFDETTSFQWVEFLRSTISKKINKAYCQSTLRYYYQKTISVLYSMARSGFVIKLDSLRKIRISTVPSSATYLSEKEVELLLEVELTPSQSKIRDLFVVGCCTALRFSDVIRLSSLNFSDKTISILTQKKKVRVKIPIHHLIRKIIDRNNGFSFLGYEKSVTYFNKTIKMICRRAGITQALIVENVENGKIVQKIHQKWELVSSHTARRSGATNMFLHGIEPYRIMMITGHMSETSFFQYIRITTKENAHFLSDNSFFSGLPTTDISTPEIWIQNNYQINNFSTTLLNCQQTRPNNQLAKLLPAKNDYNEKHQSTPGQ